MNKWFRNYSYLLLFFVLLYGFGGAAQAETRSITVEHQCTSLDPVHSIFKLCDIFQSLFMTPLLSVSEEQMETGGYGATNYELGFGNSSIEIFLHEDARWSDGKPVVAYDYVLTLKRILNNKNAQNSDRNFIKDIAGSEFCDNLDSPKCLSGVEILGPHHFKITLDDVILTEDSLFTYHFEDLSPTPSHFWVKHGDAAFDRPDLPTYGAYKLDATNSNWKEALDTEIRLVPDPFSIQKHLQHYSMVTGIKRASWSADLIRERSLDGKIPDVLLNVSGTSFELQEYLTKQGWKTLVSTSMRGLMTALLDKNTLEPNLRDALTLLLDSEEFSSRNVNFKINSVDRLASDVESEFKVNNRFKKENKEIRMARVAELLASEGISSENRKELNLIYDLTNLETSAKLVKNILKPHGIDVNVRFFKDFGSSEFEAFNKNNDIHIEMLSWVIPAVDDNGYVFDMYRIAVVDLLEEEDSHILNELEESFFSSNLVHEKNEYIAQTEDILINRGGFAVLGSPNYVSFLAPDICFGENALGVSNYAVNVLPCDAL